MSFQKIKKTSRSLRDFFLDLILPKECVGCRTEGAWLCSKCAKMLFYKNIQACPACKKENENGAFCKNCRPKYALEGIIICSKYENRIAGELIKQMKYGFSQEVAGILGKFLAESFFIYLDQNKFPPLTDFILIPVPLHKKRKAWRGFNQSAAIARAFNPYFKLNKDFVHLTKTKNTAPQVRFKKEKRQENVKASFQWTGPDLQNKNIILLDDVFTTGATLNECAKIIKQNGAGKIWGLVLANG